MSNKIKKVMYLGMQIKYQTGVFSGVAGLAKSRGTSTFKIMGRTNFAKCLCPRKSRNFSNLWNPRRKGCLSINFTEKLNIVTDLQWQLKKI